MAIGPFPFDEEIECTLSSFFKYQNKVLFFIFECLFVHFRLNSIFFSFQTSLVTSCNRNYIQPLKYVKNDFETDTPEQDLLSPRIQNSEIKHPSSNVLKKRKIENTLLRPSDFTPLAKNGPFFVFAFAISIFFLLSSSEYIFIKSREFDSKSNKWFYKYWSSI